MSTLTRPRGPLPTRVYWVRRTILLAVPLALVVLLAALFSGGDDPAPREGAVQVDAPTLAPGADTPTEAPKTPRRTKPTKVPLPEPSGPCDPEDVVVVPTVDAAVAGKPVSMSLVLSTRTADACTVELSGASLAVTVTSGSDEVWTTRHCPRAVPSQEVVARRETTTRVGMSWNGRRSEENCAAQTDWAGAGYYHVETALKGGEPDSVQFRLLPVGSRVGTQDSDASTQDKGKNRSKDEDKSKDRSKGPSKNKGKDKSQDSSSQQGGPPPTSSTPSGAVEPNG